MESFNSHAACLFLNIVPQIIFRLYLVTSCNSSFYVGRLFFLHYPLEGASAPLSSMPFIEQAADSLEEGMEELSVQKCYEPDSKGDDLSGRVHLPTSSTCYIKRNNQVNMI